jgi:hypothetical protein
MLQWPTKGRGADSSAGPAIRQQQRTRHVDYIDIPRHVESSGSRDLPRGGCEVDPPFAPSSPLTDDVVWTITTKCPQGVPKEGYLRTSKMRTAATAIRSYPTLLRVGARGVRRR